MISLDVLLVNPEDEIAKLLSGKTVRLGRITTVAALPGATSSQKAGAAFVAELEDGSMALIDTTLSLFWMAAKSLAARFLPSESDAPSQDPSQGLMMSRQGVATLLAWARERELSLEFLLEAITSGVVPVASSTALRHHEGKPPWPGVWLVQDGMGSATLRRWDGEDWRGPNGTILVPRAPRVYFTPGPPPPEPKSHETE